MSGNRDEPEGGFDALVQTLECKSQVKWREKTRKLIIFATDALSHSAGDGKIAIPPINTPNDGLCHLESNGSYKYSYLVGTDYPSLDQINSKVKKNSVNIIWAVTKEQFKYYKNLTHFIEGSYAGQLTEDSSNIVELVQNQYNSISSSVEMTDTASDYVKLRYFSQCLDGGSLIETNKCNSLKIGKKVEFTVEVKLTSCPKTPSEWKRKFLIQPVSTCKSNISKNQLFR